MEDRFTYGLNPEKLGAVSSYLCDPNTAPAEFLLVKSQYLAETGRAAALRSWCLTPPFLRVSTLLKTYSVFKKYSQLQISREHCQNYHVS